MKRKVDVHIPAGIDSGMRLRMEGYGEAGEYGAPNGDLFIEVQVQPDRRFTRLGNNLETTVAISPAQAVIGSMVEVEMIDGRRVELKIPAGVQEHTGLKISGEGVRRRGRPGDLLVRIHIIVPKHLNQRESELYEELLAIEGHPHPQGKKGFFHDVMDKVMDSVK